MRIVRRLFVVPLANNNHGKSTMIRAMVSQGLGKAVQTQRKGVRNLVSPWGRPINSYVFGRSYQEVEKGAYGSVLNALDGNDPDWRERELIVMPSHVGRNDHADIAEMIEAGHSAGFDVVSVSVILSWDGGDNRSQFSSIWPMCWDERWTVPNPWPDHPKGQLEALGGDLWAWICRGLAS